MIHKILFFLWLALGFICSTIAETSSGALTVHVEDVDADNGILMIGLFTSEETYDADQGQGEAGREQAYQSVTAEVHDGQADYVFERLPYGDYAIKLYHDENNNGELDKNFIGIPSEDYGFSNNPRTFFGPASYRDALFEFNAPEKTVTIHLKGW